MDEFYSSASPEFRHSLGTLQIWAALCMADQGLTSLCVKIDNENQESQLMDFGIMKNFSHQNIYSLESQIDLIEHTWKSYGNSIEDVKKWFAQSQPLLANKYDENSRKIKDEDEKNAISIVQENCRMIKLY